MSNSITVVRPIPVTPAMLIATDVAETDYAEWAVGKTYSVGERCISNVKHKVYQSKVDGNVGNDPDTDAAGLNWITVGATNRWKPFDASVSTQVRQADSFSYQIRPGMAITSLAVLNITGATQLRGRLIDSTAGTVYDRTIDLRRVPLSSGWWQWYFGERSAPTQALLNDLPSYPTADLHLDVVGTADLAVGVILPGQARQFGLGVQYGARLGIQDYSRKEPNEFGDVYLVERAFANRASFTLTLLKEEVDRFHRFLSDVRATACLWIGSDYYESATVYGFYKSFDIVISYYDYSDCELELEGLT